MKDVDFTVELFQEVDEFILAQDVNSQSAIYNVIRILNEFGYLIREPYSKALEDGIFELRCNGINITIRLLYFFVPNKKAVITNAFVKKTQQTPRNEIELAKERRAEYVKNNTV